jgi:magnesium transporter
MLTICREHAGALRLELVRAPDRLPDDALWVDLLEPSPEEREWIATRLGISLPEEDEVDEIEATSRFVDDASGLQIRSYFFLDSAQSPRNASVALLLGPRRLVTVRYEDAAPFRLLGRQIRAGRFTGRQPMDFFIALLETKVDQLADVLERQYRLIERLSEQIFDQEPSDLEGVVLKLGSHQNVVDKVRLALLDQERALASVLRARHGEKALRTRLRGLLDDLRSLKDHAGFIFQKLDFLMDATHGRINTEQNRIIKIFSIAAVVFLPPTLVASIYGMNFRWMPELDWWFGYPLALLAMLVSGVAPYVFFRYRGWL